ncbi:glycosyltransferase [candidate division KSB1 bacterium]|nr:glycosyltransferase [candidate division KSB1 bacterium]
MTFLGRRSDIESLLHTFDVFVLPSLWEGFLNVVLETMACGKPVIATAVEGTVELVQHNVTGLLVEKENSAGLAEAMNSCENQWERRADSAWSNISA